MIPAEGSGGPSGVRVPVLDPDLGTSGSAGASGGPVDDEGRAITRMAAGRDRFVDALVAVWAVILVVSPLTDNSLMTHLATGRLILGDGTVPSVDPYSYTAAGTSWVVQSWLPSVALAGAESLAGDLGLRLLIGATKAATVAGAWFLVRPVESLLARVALFAPLVLLGTHAWTERPHLVGLLGMLAILAIIDRRLGPLWALPVLLVWTCSHGSFPLAAVMLIAAGVGRLLDHESPRSELMALAASGAGVLLAALGPVGFDLLLFPIKLLGASEARSRIVEWAPLEFFSPVGALMLVLIGLAGAGLARRFSWRVLLVTLPFVVLPYTAIRHISPAALVLIWAGVVGLSDWTDSFTAKLPTPSADRRLHLGAKGLVLMGTTLGVVGLGFGPAWALQDYPVAAVDELENRGWIGEGRHRVLSNDLAGNYLTVRLGDSRDVFVDDRVDMYPAEIIDSYVAVLDGEDEEAEVIERWDIELIMWPSADAELGSDGADPDEENKSVELFGRWGFQPEFELDGWTVWCPAGGCPAP